MANNKVVFGNTTIMDITDTTATASDVAAGEVFYSNDGVRRVGTADYMDKVSNPTAGDILVTDAGGQAIDSGVQLSAKQNTLVSGENLRTVNGHDLLGAGNITLSIPTAVSDLTNDSGFQTQSEVEALILDELSRFDKLDYEIVTTLPATGTAGVRYLVKHTSDDRYEEYIYINGQWYDIGATDEVNLSDYYTKQETDLLLDDKVNYTDHATDSAYGIVKLNPNESISVNANGQLTVGGRLGQFPDGGVYYPTTITPTNVGSSSFLMTDGAKGLSVSSRNFAIMAGANLTCKSAAAGATQYRITNSQSNRFACFAAKGGRLALNQTDASTNGTALITNIAFANGNPISAYFGPNESSNDIIITVDRTVNPSAATTALRIYGTSLTNDVIAVGQGVGASNGKAISLGQSCFAGGNQTIAFGNSSIVLANNSVAFGHTHLVNKQFCFAAGQGHDFTSASNGAGAVGVASSLSSNTAFAVGNGVFNSNGNITRSNAFEVTTDGGIVLKSENGTRYKITVSNAGAITVAVAT